MNPYRVQHRQAAALARSVDRMVVQQHLHFRHQAAQPTSILSARQNFGTRIGGCKLRSDCLHLKRCFTTQQPLAIRTFVQLETAGLQMIGEYRRQRRAFSGTHASRALQRNRRQTIQTRREVYRLSTQPETNGTLACGAGANDGCAGILRGGIAQLKGIEHGRIQSPLPGLDPPPEHRTAPCKTCKTCKPGGSTGTFLVLHARWTRIGRIQIGNDQGHGGRRRLHIFSSGRDLRYGSRMKLTDEKIGGINLIRSYAAGEVRIGETVIRGSCLVAANQIVSDWRPRTAADLSVDDLQPVLEMKPEVVVIGSGPRQEFPAPEILGAVLSRGIGCEVMDTGAACRTYNILASEGRTVVVALLLGSAP